MTAARAARILFAATPLLVAALIAKLWITGTLGYYVNDRTVWIVLAGGLLFLAVGVISVRAAVRQQDGGAGFSWRKVVFLIPVLVGLVAPANPLSASSGQSSSLGALALASHVSSGGAGDAFGYWVNNVSQHSDAGWWAGQHVTLVGFSAREVGVPAHGFIVGRYLVTCCVVDATMFGFPAVVRGGAVPPEGAWVQVSGVFGNRFWTDASGSQWPIIEKARVAPVSIPASPYLSP